MSDRRVALLLIGLGVAVSGLTLAVGEGLVTGVRAEWPAHILAGVLVVIGLVALRQPREERRLPGAIPKFGERRGTASVRPNPRLWYADRAAGGDVSAPGGGEVDFGENADGESGGGEGGGGD